MDNAELDRRLNELAALLGVNPNQPRPAFGPDSGVPEYVRGLGMLLVKLSERIVETKRDG